MSRVIFMGTPDFAVPSLRALLDYPNFDVVGVVTQPDRPAGRSRQLRAPAVKVTAGEAGIPVMQPKSLRTAEAFEALAAWRPDVIVVAAFGQILRQNVLDLPPRGCINVHASLLPRWRGAAPINAALRAGDGESGVTIMQMDAGLDTGPVLRQRMIALGPRETAQSLHDKLADLGASLLVETLPGYLRGEITPQPQPTDESLVTYAPQLSKADGAITWTLNAVEIDRLVRAYTPWPGTYTYWQGRRLHILAGQPARGSALPGAVVAHGSGFAIGTGEGLFVPEAVKLEGKSAADAEAFLRGHATLIGSTLS